MTQRIGENRVKDSSITDAKIVSVANTKITGLITSAQIASVANTKITGVIDTAQIADSAITTAKIAANAVVTSDIADANVTDAKIVSVANTKITGILTVSQGGTGTTSSTGSGSVVLATSPTLTDPIITGTITEDVFTITDGAAFEVDPGNGSVQLITLGANRTPKATNFVAGESVTMMILDGSAFTITWTDSTWGTGGVVWVGGAAPVLDTTKYTVIQFWKVSTQVYGALVGFA